MPESTDLSQLRIIDTVSDNNLNAESINTILTQIQENFNRILHAPYLQGPIGSCVTIISEPLWEVSSNYSASNPDIDEVYLTNFGKKVFNTIYSKYANNENINIKNAWNALMTASNTTITKIREFLGEVAKEYCPVIVEEGEELIIYSCDYFAPLIITTEQGGEPVQELAIPSIQCFKLVDYKNIVGIHYFEDIRTRYLTNTGIYDGSTFEDMSCALYGYYTPATDWVLDKLNIVPNIVYDGDAFVWKLNGYETGIPASGVVGPSGKNTYVSVFGGNINPNNTSSENDETPGNDFGEENTPSADA